MSAFDEGFDAGKGWRGVMLDKVNAPTVRRMAEAWAAGCEFTYLPNGPSESEQGNAVEWLYGFYLSCGRKEAADED